MQAARLKCSVGLPGTSLGFNGDFMINLGVPKTYAKLFNFYYEICRNVVAGDQGLLRSSVGLSGLLWVSGSLDLWVSLLAFLGLSGHVWSSLDFSGLDFGMTRTDILLSSGYFVRLRHD